MNPGLVVKLRPAGPWRIGPDSGARNRVDVIYHSDSLYSAVTSAMSRMGSLEAWLDATARSQTPALCFSSCFPFLDDIGLVAPPRTIWPPTSPAAMSARVRWKSARFIPLSVVESILSGKKLNENLWSVDGASGCLVPAGKAGPFRTSVRWNAAVDRLTGACERHATACIEFREGCGLWTVVGFQDEAARDQWQEPVKAAFRLLADSGFGGERSRGWGRSEAPEFVEGTLPGLIVEYKRREPRVEVEAASPEAEPVADPVPEAEAAAPAAEAVLLETEPAAEAVLEAEPAEPLIGAAPVRERSTTEPETAPVAAAIPEAAESMVGQALSPAEAEASAPEAEAVAEPVLEAAASAPEAEAVSLETEPAAEAVLEAEPAEPLIGAATVRERSTTEPETAPVAAAIPEAAESMVGQALSPAKAATPASEAEPAAEPVLEAATPASEAEPAPAADAAENRGGTGEESPSFARIDRLKPAPPAAAVRAPDLTEPMRAAAEREVAPAVPAVHLQAHWLLSLFTPAPGDAVDWGRGSYTVLARGGRIDSPSGNGELKKQIQMVAEGSVLYADGVPLGGAADVAPDGFAHPVFRAGFALAIPLPEVH
jgi:CRISPR type III-A-associated RAMP protein Csm4